MLIEDPLKAYGRSMPIWTGPRPLHMCSLDNLQLTGFGDSMKILVPVIIQEFGIKKEKTLIDSYIITLLLKICERCNRKCCKNSSKYDENKPGFISGVRS